MSLITMEGQPVQELQIKGKIIDGVCRAAYKCKFENKLENPIEISFTFPLPSGVCSTQFKVSFGDEKTVSHVMRDDSSRIEYDDTLAQGDFAAMAQVNNENEIRIDVGTLAPKEKCSAALYFVIALDPFPKGYLLILPTSIRTHSKDIRVGMSPPSLKLTLEVSDSRKIESITTPFNDKTVIDTKTGMITCDSLSIFNSLYVKILHQDDLFGRCIYQRYEGKTFMNVVATAPRAYRDHLSQYTVICDNGPALTNGQMSHIMRALEFFILSVPHGCKFNYCTYGTLSQSLFDSPMELTGNRHKEALSFLKQQGGNDNRNLENLSFKQMHDKILSKVNTSEMESVVVVIASSFPSDVTLLSDQHSYFLLDPFSCGDMRHLAHKNGACYVPIPDEAAIIETILSVIKYTASYQLDDSKFVIDGDEEFPLPPVIPGCPFTTYLITEKENVKNIDFICGDHRIILPIFEARLGIIPQLWAYEKTTLNHENPKHESESEEGQNGVEIEAEELELAKQILTPENSAVIAISREDEINGDVTHIDTRLSRIGIGWIVEKPEKKNHKPNNNNSDDGDDDEMRPVHPIHPIYPIHPIHNRPMPIGFPHAGVRPHFPQPFMLPQHRPIFVGNRRDNRKMVMNAAQQTVAAAPHNDDDNENTNKNINNTNNRIKSEVNNDNNNNDSNHKDGGNEVTGNNNSTSRRVFIGKMHAKTKAEKTEGGLNVIDATKETPRTAEAVADEVVLQAKACSKKPFFLLRVLQMQNPEGSWTDEKLLVNSCGFPIPEESKGMKREQFMTAFIIACIQLKGAKDMEKWELVVEKALIYLENTDSNADWNSIISSIKNDLLH